MSPPSLSFVIAHPLSLFKINSCHCHLASHPPTATVSAIVTTSIKVRTWCRMTVVCSPLHLHRPRLPCPIPTIVFVDILEYCWDDDATPAQLLGRQPPVLLALELYCLRKLREGAPSTSRGVGPPGRTFEQRCSLGHRRLVGDGRLGEVMRQCFLLVGGPLA